MIIPKHITIPIKEIAMTTLARSFPSRRPIALRFIDMGALARSRRALAGLGADALADIGVSRTAASREAGRPAWDMPRGWPRCRS